MPSIKQFIIFATFWETKIEPSASNKLQLQVDDSEAGNSFGARPKNYSEGSRACCGGRVKISRHDSISPTECYE